MKCHQCDLSDAQWNMTVCRPCQLYLRWVKRYDRKRTTKQRQPAPKLPKEAV